MQVHHHDVGLQVEGERDGATSVARPAHDLDVVHGAEQQLQAVAELLVVVDDQDAQRFGHDSSIGPIGSSASTTVPRRSVVNVHVPPSSSARSSMEERPTPVGRPSANPTPSSSMRTQSRPSSRRNVTYAWARLCRTALVTASSAIRYAATSIAAGRGSTSSSASTFHIVPWFPYRQPVLLGPLAESRDEAQLVERRRTQAVDQTTYLRDVVPREVRESFQHLGGLVGVGRDQVLGGLQSHGHRGQRRAQTVVQVATQPTAFLLAGGDQLCPERCGNLPAIDQHGLDESADLRPDVLEEPAVAAPEGVADGVRLQVQRPDRRPACDQVDDDRAAAARLADRGDEGFAGVRRGRLDRRVRHPEAPGEHGQGLGERFGRRVATSSRRSSATTDRGSSRSP